MPTEIRAADMRGRKRESEQSAEDLEAEIHEGNDTMELEAVSLDLRWSDNGDYMMSPMQLEVHGQKCLATSPEFFDDLVSSVKFSPDKKHTFCKMTLGGATVLVWKPDGLVDDSSLMSLDNEQGFEGMKEEIRNLVHCQTRTHYQPLRINCVESSKSSLTSDSKSMGFCLQISHTCQGEDCSQRLESRCVSKETRHFFAHAQCGWTTFRFGAGSSETVATERIRCGACLYALTYSEKGMHCTANAPVGIS